MRAASSAYAVEVDEALHDVHGNQSHLYLVAYIDAPLAANDAAFDGRLEDADISSFGSGAGDDAIEYLADLLAEQAGGQHLSHQTFHLPRGVFAIGAVSGDFCELAFGINRTAAFQSGFEQPLCHQIGI